MDPKETIAYSLKNVMISKPYSEITIYDIMTQCNYSNRNSIYHYFRNKAEILEYLLVLIVENCRKSDYSDEAEIKLIAESVYDYIFITNRLLHSKDYYEISKLLTDKQEKLIKHISDGIVAYLSPNKSEIKYLITQLISGTIFGCIVKVDYKTKEELKAELESILLYCINGMNSVI